MILLARVIVVRITTAGKERIYDPSYGEIYTNLQNFQDRAIAGFYTMGLDRDGSKVMRIRRNVVGGATPTPLGLRFTIR